MTMNHTAVAIREAADRGGYGYRWWKANDIEDGVGYNALPNFLEKLTPKFELNSKIQTSVGN